MYHYPSVIPESNFLLLDENPLRFSAMDGKYSAQNGENPGGILAC